MNSLKPQLIEWSETWQQGDGSPNNTNKLVIEVVQLSTGFYIVLETSSNWFIRATEEDVDDFANNLKSLIKSKNKQCTNATTFSDTLKHSIKSNIKNESI